MIFILKRGRSIKLSTLDSDHVTRSLRDYTKGYVTGAERCADRRLPTAVC